MEYNGKIIDLRNEAQKMLSGGLRFSGEAKEPELSVNEFKTVIGNERPKYFIPLDVESSDLMILSGALSLGTIVFANDQEIMDFVQEHKTESTDKIANVGNFMAEVAGPSLAIGAYFIGAVRHNGKLKKIGMLSVSATLANAIINSSVKVTMGRVRPNHAESPYEFFSRGDMSFYSGHTSSVFVYATVIAEVYNDKPLVPYIAYGAAALTAYARMSDKMHWGSDVLIGAAAGHLITKILIRTLEGSGSEGRSGLIVIPDFSQNIGAKVLWTPGYSDDLDCEKSGLKGKELMRLCIDEAFARAD
jgi:membrane-associated phospholipid phosphatase